MPFFDILRLALRNLREAKLRASLTTVGVVIGVAVIVTMVSFGLGLQRNTVERFRALDLFNEVNVIGRSVGGLVAELNRRQGGDEGGQDKGEPRKTERALDDAAIEEISQMPGVAYVEPNVTVTAYVRSNGRTLQKSAAGARIPSASSRFQSFDAGSMISSPDADEIVVDSSFLKAFGYERPEDAVGQTVEFLAPRRESPFGAFAGAAKGRKADGEGGDESDAVSIFGIPLEGAGVGVAGGADASGDAGRLAARTLRIAGVLHDESKDAKGKARDRRGFGGLMPNAGLYVPLKFAREWRAQNRNPLEEVALQLARESGAIGKDEGEGYPTATVRVSDPAAVGDVVKRLKDAGFNAFDLMGELDEIRKVFLIINSALGLLGGISLLVASFGIANTMIMSIFERTREIGIMKAVGAEDLDIKLIFFCEAAVIGFTGGSVGALTAWGVDGLANRIVHKFALEPKGTSFIDFFAIPPWLWLGAILFAVLVAVLAALYPAARAARIDPVKALRHD